MSKILNKIPLELNKAPFGLGDNYITVWPKLSRKRSIGRVNVNKQSTILEVKKQIEDQVKMPAKEQVILLNGIILDDRESLETYSNEAREVSIYVISDHRPFKLIRTMLRERTISFLLDEQTK